MLDAIDENKQSKDKHARITPKSTKTIHIKLKKINNKCKS